MGVPMEYPSAPTTSAGRIIPFHFLEVAIAAAVPGPPTEKRNAWISIDTSTGQKL
jgi:hypothetical protein